MEGSTCRNPFFERWKKLIVILCFSIHLLPLVAKLYSVLNTEAIWLGSFYRDTFFKRWQKLIGFFAYISFIFNRKKCNQFQTLKVFGMKVFVWIHFFWWVTKKLYSSFTYFSFLWFKNYIQFRTLKFFGMELLDRILFLKCAKNW